jgi:hypothetical protein
MWTPNQYDTNNNDQTQASQVWIYLSQYVQSTYYFYNNLQPICIYKVIIILHNYVIFYTKQVTGLR